MTDFAKIIYVDDEEHSLDTFQYMIEKNISDVTFFKRYNRPDLFLKEWEQGNLSFDLLFLDIEMFPINGIQLLLEMKKINSRFDFDLVFLTAYDDFALDAFRHNAIDYLLKPLMIDDLVGCIQKWKNKKIQNIDPVQIELLRDFFESPHRKPEQLAVPTMDGYEIIDIKKIIRCEAERNYSHIYLSGKPKSFLVSKNLKELENALSCNGFLRVHHSHLINPTHLKRVLKTDGGIVEMVDNTKIRISRNKNLILESIFSNISKI